MISFATFELALELFCGFLESQLRLECVGILRKILVAITIRDPIDPFYEFGA